ncbi:MAG: carbohydrate kinase family protein [Nitrososphaerota archaeon]|jgi:sugar/nucleoside kinase (ribokinase family)|nr:carbohydrate kinase family protein [Nitrososphaerota archaeon]MDG6942020.1 carbohydrate kinase family protein [Nitrososphaerota archaeon]MDG6942485.1 carbohydrate kinase family protein [Nitrososphaerota archaeon]MDG6948272.1 carbohydrate kinase family protein [Nitrososphaerota archaeon]MDG6951672.1 carbohydrate kinase family protein [Nitrososphaerota archaeon]
MPRRFDVAVMHDYFVDRLVHIRGLGRTMAEVAEKAAAGGGGIHGTVQEEIRGGNAVNLAHALARLGLRTLLITHCEPAHEHLLRSAFKGLKAELRVRPLPAGLTVAFEESVNVMLSDGRGAADFGPDALDEEDWASLEGSRVVCSVNWAANRRGTQLLQGLRRRLGPEKTIYIDPADFRDRLDRFGELARLVSKGGLVDWVSMNEFESMAAATALGLESTDRASRCLTLARELGVVFDMHCVDGAYTSEGTRVTACPTRVIRTRRLTGAGDVWDAASIYGRLKEMDETGRLRFANRAAKLYLEAKEPVPPTLSELQAP